MSTIPVVIIMLLSVIIVSLLAIVHHVNASEQYGDNRGSTDPPYG